MACLSTAFRANASVGFDPLPDKFTLTVDKVHITHLTTSACRMLHNAPGWGGLTAAGCGQADKMASSQTASFTSLPEIHL